MAANASANPLNLTLEDQLKRKEADLILAAELGKALLDKNEELSRQNETITEEYTAKLELLEQEKYLLRRKLDSTLSNCESRLSELQADYLELQSAYEEGQARVRSAEDEKSKLLNKYTEANSKLQALLEEALKGKDKAMHELQSLKDSNSLRNVIYSESVADMESAVQSQLELINAKKLGLEKQVKLLSHENESLSVQLQSCLDKLSKYEVMNQAQLIELSNVSFELQELRSSNQSLSATLSLLNHKRSVMSDRSLLDELQCSGDYDNNEHELNIECDPDNYHSNHSNNSMNNSHNSNSDNSDKSMEQEPSPKSTSNKPSNKPDCPKCAATKKKHSAAILDLNNRLELLTLELGATLEERDVARADLQSTELSKDEIVKKCWETRDQAVARKNKAELELARTRIDMMQVNSLLMEAVQQKIQLSQELEQWQVDMQQLLDEQMHDKLSKHESKMALLSPNSAASTGSNSGSAGSGSITSGFERKRNKLFATLFSRTTYYNTAPTTSTPATTPTSTNTTSNSNSNNNNNNSISS